MWLSVSSKREDVDKGGELIHENEDGSWGGLETVRGNVEVELAFTLHEMINMNSFRKQQLLHLKERSGEVSE